jgi:flagellar biosynthesis chaperone FliJ
MQRKIEELAYLANLREQQFMDELSITRYSQM